MSNESIQLGDTHESLYFMDGNVVLLAPRIDKPALLFRVHKSVLSSHSPAFSDMFDVCSPSDGSSKSEADQFYDGVPLVHIPDYADHLESVLKILYYQSTLPWTPLSPHNPALITPILELSRKYGIDRIREQILRHLESDWPQTLKGWDRLERDIEFMANDSDVQRIDDHLPEPASAIKLAHQFDIPSILPAAFYHLSRLAVLDDWDKTHADLSLRIRNPTNRTARWELLSAKDFHCLLLGRAGFAETLRGSIKAERLFPASENTLSRNKCSTGEGLWDDICDRCSQSTDPLALLKIESDKNHHCSTCTKALKTRILAVRAQLWEGLGKLFHLKDE